MAPVALKKGTGSYFRAETWPRTKFSNRQNKVTRDYAKNKYKFKTAILSDSLLRPVLQGLTHVPDDWFVNCTPGATFADIGMEVMMGVGIPPGVNNVIVVCGTNQAYEVSSVAADLRRLYGKILMRSPSGTTV